MGLLINIEAIDRAGKSTQGSAIHAALTEAGLRAARFDFPDTPKRNPETPTLGQQATGVLIERYLDEGLSFVDLRDAIFRMEGMTELAPATRELICANIEEKIVQVLFSVNRRERMVDMRAAIAAHDAVVVTRHFSAWAYGVAQGVGRPLVAAMESDLPRPDMTFLLELDPGTARARRNESGYDRYEADDELQARVRAAYAEMVRTDLEEAETEGRAPRFLRVDATLPAEDITTLIVSEVRRRMESAA